MTVVRRFGAVVLAAGAGRRFGGGKLLACWGGRPVLAHALEAAWAAPVEAVLLVTGADLRVGSAARAIAGDRSLRVVHAVDHAEGMGASLRAGLAALPAGLDGAFVFLADMPAVPHEVLGPLARAVVDGAPAAAPAHAGSRGHPAVLGAALIARWPELRGDAGARAWLDALGDALVLVPAGAGVLFDIDQPADLETHADAASDT